MRLPDWDLFAAAFELPGSEPLYEDDQRVGHWVVLPARCATTTAALRDLAAPRPRAHGGPRVSEEQRALSFGPVAEDYEATRPGWPLEPFTKAFAHFGVRDAPDIVDVAAGTGKLTRTLALLAGTLVAVEPDADLRAVMQRELPEVEVVAGTAEAAAARRPRAPTSSARGRPSTGSTSTRDRPRSRACCARGGILIAGWNSRPTTAAGTTP